MKTHSYACLGSDNAIVTLFHKNVIFVKDQGCYDRTMNSPKSPTPVTVLVIALVTILLVTAFMPASSANANGLPAPMNVIAPKVIYGDRLTAGWQNWSWNAAINLSNSKPRQSGSRSIKVVIQQAWGALYLHSDPPLNTAGYTHLQFYIHGGSTGGQSIKLVANGNTNQTVLVKVVKGKWTKAVIPLSSLGSPASLVDLYWQDAAGKAEAGFYVDSIRLISKAGSVTLTPTKVPTKVSTKTPTKVPTKAPTQAPSRTPTRSLTQAPTRTPTKAPTKAPTPTRTPSGSRFFDTLPPGTKLPSDAECAAAIKARPENKRTNVKANATRGNQGIASNFFTGGDNRANTEIGVRVDGNFTGTTDEILQWAACKWGFNEDIVRAQAAVESWWRQGTKGDWTTDATRCAPGHGLGVDGQAGQCPESFGILQNRYPYEQSGWPGMDTSTAFNADLAYAEMRACFEGYETWLNNVDKGSTYVAGDVWGCVGRWYAGRWHTSPAESYTSTVKSYLNQRIWETSNFQEP